MITVLGDDRLIANAFVRKLRHPPYLNRTVKGHHMEAKISFSEQYRHPEWQKKRLESLSNSEFVCQRCFSSDEHLHVHHKRYVKDRMVWEYSIDELEVLCEYCHEQTHAEKDVLQNLLAQLPSEAIPEITSIIAGYCSSVSGPARLKENDIRDSMDNHWNDHIGQIAGLISSRSTLDNLISFLDALTRAEGGDNINFKILKRDKLVKELGFV